jgi:hypothetical protein
MFGRSSDCPEDVDQVVKSIPTLTCELDERSCLIGYSALFRGTGDSHTSATPELEQAFIAQLTQSPENRVGVDLQDSSKVTGRRQTLARLGLPLRDSAAYLSRDLLVQVKRFVAVNLDVQHSASDNSAISKVLENPI